MNRPGRVLVVDDDAYWHETLTEALHDGGFYVDAAASTGEAIEKLETSFYHLLILDIRMEEGDESNVEGMELLRELVARNLDASMKIIMLSAYGTKAQMREAFHQYSVSDFLSKEEYTDQRFLEEVKSIFEGELNINLGLEIRWKQVGGPEPCIINLEVGDKRVKRNSPEITLIAAELDDLLCRLFYKARILQGKPLSVGRSGAGVLWAKPFYKKGPGEARVVKFGDFRRIDAEYRAYNEHVEGFIGGDLSTHIPAEGLRRTARLGGIIYSLVGVSGDQTESFREFYLRADPAQIKEVLNGLFFKTCNSWYKNLGDQDLHDLTTEYQGKLGLSEEKLERSLSEGLRSVQGKQRLRFNSLNTERTFTNPLLAMKDFKFEETTYVCRTHGDLNENNVLVDKLGNTWLIDFDSTGFGHILRDVAELDAVVRFQLLAADDATLEERLAMEEALGSIRRFGEVERLDAAFSTDNPALAKAYGTAAHLRKIAYRLVLQSEELTEYNVALFYYAVNSIKFLYLSSVQRQHALLSASLLADILEQS